MNPKHSSARAEQPILGRHAGRARFIDATRGTAMLVVLLSHFGQTYFSRHDGWAPFVLGNIGFLASPTFTMLSGLLVGFLYRTRPAQFERLRIKLFDRGLFLLTVGHGVIVVAHLAMVPTLRWLPITDAIGVSVIVGPWLVTRLRPANRLLVSLAVYTTSWVMVGWWHPSAAAGTFISETLFGSLDGTYYSYAFPLLPWFSLDLASTVIGEWLGALYAEGDYARMSRVTAGLALAGFAIAIGAAIAMKLLFGLYQQPGSTGLAYALRAVHQKSPPGPVYFLFHASLGLGLLSTYLFAERRGCAHRIMRYTAALGQASLFTFVVQYYVYYTALHLLRDHLPFAWAWPVYFLLTVLLVTGPALEWHRRGYNRYITVGYQHLRESWPRYARWTRSVEPIAGGIR